MLRAIFAQRFIYYPVAGKTREKSSGPGASAIHWINHDLPVNSAIVFLNAYLLDSAIQQLNNRDHLKTIAENSGIGSPNAVSHQSWTTSPYQEHKVT